MIIIIFQINLFFHLFQALSLSPFYLSHHHQHDRAASLNLDSTLALDHRIPQRFMINSMAHIKILLLFTQVCHQRHPHFLHPLRHNSYYMTIHHQVIILKTLPHVSHHQHWIPLRFRLPLSYDLWDTL